MDKRQDIRPFNIVDPVIQLGDSLPTPPWISAYLISLLGFLISYYLAFRLNVLYTASNGIAFLEDRVGLSHFVLHVPIVLSAYYYVAKSITNLFCDLLSPNKYLRKGNSKQSALALTKFQQEMQHGFSDKRWLIFLTFISVVALSSFKDFMLPSNIAIIQVRTMYYATTIVLGILLLMSFLVILRVFLSLWYLVKAFREFDLGSVGLAAATFGIEALTRFSRNLVFWVVITGIGLLTNDILTSLIRTQNTRFLGFGLDLVVMWVIYFMGGLVVIFAPLYAVQIGIQKWKAKKLDLLSKRFESNVTKGKKYSEVLMASNEVSRLSGWRIKQEQISQFISLVLPVMGEFLLRYFVLPRS